nr:MAG TPA: hypothetical protein [Bacteriophage sp.]
MHIIIRKQLLLYTGFIVLYSANFAKIFCVLDVAEVPV